MSPQKFTCAHCTSQLLPLLYLYFRSQSLDLSIQQRFRWVHSRIDTEPVRSQLSRHLLRRVIHKYGGQIPVSNDPVLRYKHINAHTAINLGLKVKILLTVSMPVTKNINVHLYKRTKCKKKVCFTKSNGYIKFIQYICITLSKSK